jgi:tRNA G18 (ribose-2'-O)-methylase SpoU
MNKPNFVVILENIRSLYNVGSIFRTAEAAGVDEIILIGSSGIIIPNNENDTRQAVLNPKLSKTALGTEKKLNWQHFGKTHQAINYLKNKNKKFQVVALEQTANSKHYKNFNFQFPLAIILGNEKNGIQKSTLQKADAVVEIPMLGTHSSLNVSNAAAICLFSALQQGKTQLEPF